MTRASLLTEMDCYVCGMELEPGDGLMSKAEKQMICRRCARYQDAIYRDGVTENLWALLSAFMLAVGIILLYVVAWVMMDGQ